MKGFTSPNYEKLLFSHAPVAIAYVSRDGKFVEVNQVFQTLLGYSEFELSNRHFASITHPDDAEMDRAEAGRLISDPESDGYQILKRYITKDGRTVWCRLCVQALRESGAFMHYIVHALDLPSSPAYKIEATPNGISVRPSLRWFDMVRDNPRESFGVLVTLLVVFKTLDITVLDKLAEVFKVLFTK